MLTNCSTSSNDSALQSSLSVINTESPISTCFILRPSSFLYFGNYIVQIVLLLPLCVLVLYIGLKRRQQQRSNSMATKMSHSDCFTYHLMLMELIGVSGLVLRTCAVFTHSVKTNLVGVCIYSVAWYGELFFHILTCVERFLAVVHPIIYVSLKSERGVKIRNVCTGFVWLLSVGEAGLQNLEKIAARLDFFLVTFTLVVTSLCSLSILYVLVRPRPGKQGPDRKRIDQSKKRAFYTVVVILGVLSLKCVWNMTWSFLYLLGPKHCIAMSLGVWLNIPSSFVLPVLFLQRAGLLACCRIN